MFGLALPGSQVVRSNEDREKAAFRQIVGLPDELPGHRPLDPCVCFGRPCPSKCMPACARVLSRQPLPAQVHACARACAVSPLVSSHPPAYTILPAHGGRAWFACARARDFNFLLVFPTFSSAPDLRTRTAVYCLYYVVEEGKTR